MMNPRRTHSGGCAQQNRTGGRDARACSLARARMPRAGKLTLPCAVRHEESCARTTESVVARPRLSCARARVAAAASTHARSHARAPTVGARRTRGATDLRPRHERCKHIRDTSHAHTAHAQPLTRAPAVKREVAAARRVGWLRLGSRDFPTPQSRDHSFTNAFRERHVIHERPTVLPTVTL